MLGHYFTKVSHYFKIEVNIFDKRSRHFQKYFDTTVFFLSHQLSHDLKKLKNILIILRYKVIITKSYFKKVK